MLQRTRPLVATALTLGAVVLMSPAPARAVTCGDLMIVFDRSESMKLKIGARTKWDIAKDALSRMLADYDATLRFGFGVFPGKDVPQDCASPAEPCAARMCDHGGVDIAPADGQKSAIEMELGALIPAGATPTWKTIESVAANAWSKDTSRKRTVLLLTDGRPNCPDGDVFRGFDESDFAVAASKSIEQVKKLHALGIDVYVVGFSAMVGTEIDPAVLDKMAEAGGTARPSPAPHKYYDATDEKALHDALATIGMKVAGATVGGCAAGGKDGGGSGADGGAPPPADPQSDAGKPPAQDDGGVPGDDERGGAHGKAGPAGCACRMGERKMGSRPWAMAFTLAFATAIALRRRPRRSGHRLPSERT